MRLTISTENFKNELMDWINIHYYSLNAQAIDIIGNGEYALTVEACRGISENLADLFENIILEKNQVANRRQRLKHLLKNVVFEPCRDKIVNSLEEYIEENNSLNLEGYITFRMSEYVGAVNLALYAVMKKLLY